MRWPALCASHRWAQIAAGYRVCSLQTVAANVKMFQVAATTTTQIACGGGAWETVPRVRQLQKDQLGDCECMLVCLLNTIDHTGRISEAAKVKRGLLARK